MKGTREILAAALFTPFNPKRVKCRFALFIVAEIFHRSRAAAATLCHWIYVYALKVATRPTKRRCLLRGMHPLLLIHFWRVIAHRRTTALRRKEKNFNRQENRDELQSWSFSPSFCTKKRKNKERRMSEETSVPSTPTSCTMHLHILLRGYEWIDSIRCTIDLGPGLTSVSHNICTQLEKFQFYLFEQFNFSKTLICMIWNADQDLYLRKYVEFGNR